YPSIADPEEVLQRALAVPPVLPVNYLVLPDGSVQRITDPVIFGSPDQVRAAVQRHLDVQP
ncbi:MAG: TlpA family protein disulfide reductase, partial [Haloechinothrix sp.]